ncbi:DEAD/DEAH box helicase [Phormidium sp. FACHB-1136]|nr:DEAD/DEAH box helicase [Phormidium sp. FACHB-1136]
MAEAILKAHDVDTDPWDLIEELEERKLLFDFNIWGSRLYRTRMAESVRLFARLRQLFPNRDWQVSPTLVADYRFSLRQRVYPNRRFQPTDVLEQLETEKLINSSQRLVLEDLLVSPDRTLILADFQRRATSRMLRDLKSTSSRGMIVCAGTGTGKTLAFYLPALTHIAGLIKKTVYWTKALAIYPRQELLKDQFSDTYVEARRLDAVLQQAGQRKLTIGAFFGLTPKQASYLTPPPNSQFESPWPRESGGFTCPYLRCPKCGGSLSWRRDDIEQGRERLVCLTPSCNTEIGEDEVMLTRDRMAKTPPDILFATTEMLNRSMGDACYGHVFGVGATKPPQIVLLDEVHTYTGIHGAQVAYLLRRWQRMIGKKVQFTGLSATLQSATEFFTQLVGLPPGTVEEISPGDDVQPEGMEYLLALRGDPVSGTSLLSTSIQTAMLLRRILDPSDNNASQGTYGSRVFAFTDDLDVTNRLFHNLLDAEGRNSWGGIFSWRQPLAALRTHSATNPVERLVQGQSWHMCEEIGHTLENPLQITRTSSQDTGVDSQSDVIVATASLEIGFNDPEVGAVIQHKAPRNMASFLQRKGRAGRRHTMRPWTVVVLSDYGRDRIAYQSYDLLFNPILEERLLPLSNRYVIRIQAAFAFMDWVAQQLPSTPSGRVWKDFAEPAQGIWHQRQVQAAEIIRQVLAGGETYSALESYLQEALSLSTEDLQPVLWEPPRALMTGVLPTLLRRLATGWKRLQLPGEPELDYHTRDPLPDFVPANLFSDLLLPEVRIVTPPPTKNSTESEEYYLPILQAIKTFAPGRVSRRFGIQRGQISHWIAPAALVSGLQNLAIEQICAEYEEAGIFQVRQEDQLRDIRCIRPWTLRVEQIPTQVSDKSNAQLEWHTQIVPPDRGTPLDLPQAACWLGILEAVFSFTHNQQNPLEVRRFALGSQANLRIQENRQTQEIETSIRFIDAASGQTAGVGFAQTVDGIVFHYRIPEDFTLSPYDANRPKVHAFRTSYFRHRIRQDVRLDGIANIFQRNWLYQIYLSMLVAYALQHEVALPDAYQALQEKDLGQEMAMVLDRIFQTLNAEEPPDEGTVDETFTDDLADLSDPIAPNLPPGRQPTHERLRELTSSAKVQTVLNDLAQVLWQQPDDGWHDWAKERFRATLGGAILDACQQLCPQFDSEDLLLDLDAGPRPPDAPPVPEGIDEIWLTEASPGGSGIIEELLQRYAEDPFGFFRLVESALEPSDFEVIDSELTTLLELSETNEAVQTAFSQVRSADSHHALTQASGHLRRVLQEEGILITPAVMTGIHARILSPGSSPNTDHQLRALLRRWQAEEERLGIEVDARVFAYVASTQAELTAALPLETRQDPYVCFQVLYGRLWLRGSIVRNRAISFYNPFSIMPEADREILLDVLQPVETLIKLEEPNWQEQVKEALRTAGTASLSARPTSRQALKNALLSIMIEPVDVGFLNLYPAIEGMRRTAQGYVARLRIREAVQ